MRYGLKCVAVNYPALYEGIVTSINSAAHNMGMNIAEGSTELDFKLQAFNLAITSQVSDLNDVTVAVTLLEHKE